MQPGKCGRKRGSLWSVRLSIQSFTVIGMLFRRYVTEGLIDAINTARRHHREEAQRQNQRRYYERNREEIVQKKGEGRKREIELGTHRYTRKNNLKN